VQIGLAAPTRELIRAVPLDDFLCGNIEMMCRALVLARLGTEDQVNHAEEISWLKHELVKASGNLKKSLVANTEYAPSGGC